MTIFDGGGKVSKPIKIVLAIAALLIVYSFLPLIPFWLMQPAPNTENNQAAVQKLSKNEGTYFSFLVFSDNHAGLIFNDAATLKEIWHMNREDRSRKVPIDFVLSAGDVTLDGKTAHFKAYKKLQKLIKWPLIATIGNHDDRKLFKKYCGSEKLAFSNRNAYFIIADNEGGAPDLEWLEAELKKGKEYDHIFVSMHKPLFDPYQQDWYNVDNAPWAYKLRKLFAEYDVDMVFSGHRHMFKHEEFDGVDYMVTGGGGMLIEIPEADGGYLHYVRVVVNNDYVTYEVRKVSPPLWEYVTYYFWKEAIYWVRDLYGSGYILGRNTKILEPRVSGLNDKEYWFE